MIVLLPLAVFLAGLAGAYLGGGWVRRAGTLTMLLATAGSIALVSEARVGAAFTIGPLLAIMLLPRRAPAARLSFEAVRRRAISLGGTTAFAIFVATKFPIGENPTLLSAVPWLLGAVGAAWLISPLDARDRTEALTLLIAAGAAVLVAAVPIGTITAATSGMMALVPAIDARWALPMRTRRVVATILLLAAAITVGFALLVGTLPRPALQDLGLSLDGAALPAAALLLLAGAVTVPEGRAWIVLPGLLSLLAVAPSLRWAALAALVASRGDAGSREERLGWLALLVLAATTLLASLTVQPWSPRAQIVGLAGTLVLIAIATGPSALSALVLAASALAILQDAAAANAALVSRFQWLTAAGAALLAARALLIRQIDPPAGHRVEQQLLLGLLLLAAGAHDPLGLGALAVLLLAVDLVLWRGGRPAPAGAPAADGPFWLLQLAGSGWPPTVRFAGVTLAVIASLQTSLAWGLLSAALLVALKLTPLIDRRPAAAGHDPDRPNRAWLSPAVALACGLAPALLLRMLRA